MEKEQDESEVLETTETVTEETPTEVETSEENITLSKKELEELQAKAKERDELEEKNKKLFTRAKNAEARSATEGLSGDDALALAKADAHEDDYDTILDYAKFKKLKVREALKDTTLKAVLSASAEARKSAEVTHTKSVSRGSNKDKPEDVLQKALKGETIDSEEGMQAIFQARLARNKKR